MIKDTISVNDAIEVLNRMLEADPEATVSLFLDGRVPCNERLADDPTIQAKAHGEYNGMKVFSVGPLGIINGLFGIDEGGWGPITADVKLGCTAGCELPEGEPLRIGGECPVCQPAAQVGDVSPIGKVIFAGIERFRRTDPPDVRREGEP